MTYATETMRVKHKELKVEVIIDADTFDEKVHELLKPTKPVEEAKPVKPTKPVETEVVNKLLG